MADDVPVTLATASGGCRLAVVILAAGLGRRFGGDKLRAVLDDRPLLQHVLDVVATVAPTRTVVVVGPGPAAPGPSIEWRDEQRIENPRPADGLSSSLRIGVRACLETPDPADGVFVVLGDQPRLRREVLLALATALPAARRADAWAIVPRYRDGVGNPALLLAPGITMAATLTGDSGLGPSLRAEPGRAWEVQVEGVNPDVDTPDDLERLRRPSA
ncbi:MAG: nucleotidyltransferase family protein [Chloroflexi bacterium]|nr:nucleotidyltransferase family protein [Chloroflexota bacterium]